MKPRTLARIGAAVCLALAALFLLPLAAGVHHFGMVWPTAVLLLGAAVLRWPDFFHRLLPRRARWTAAVLAAVCLAVIGLTLYDMVRAAADRPTDDTPRTVIVLGCQVLESGQPSLILQNRIDAAAAYLRSHPNAVCIASGGKDDSETVTEAACIREALLRASVDPARIYVEDESTSTEENLIFSARLIAENDLPTDVAIASDNFHQKRAAVWAARCGLNPCSLGCQSPWPLAPSYWAREAAALVYMRLSGK